MDKLRDAKPADFASEYDPMQVSAHEDTVSLFERYSKSGDSAKLKDWAGKPGFRCGSAALMIQNSA